ncbi:MAG: tetratricopeptide repeat protein [Pirellulales bacterium]|nr:tetratricopeptide repeat protein [Pirellulales bacterium]
MRRHSILTILLALFLALGAVDHALAANEGQAALDQALELKLSATNVGELSQVIELCKKSLQDGLDADNEKFAKGLLASTLIQRATLLTGVLFSGGTIPAQLAVEIPRMRALAQQDLEDALTFDDRQPHAHYLLSRLYALSNGNRDKARTAAEEAIRLSGDDTLLAARAHVVRALLREKPEEIAAELDTALELAPEDPEVLRARGAHALEHRDLAKAIEVMKLAVEVERERADNHELLGMAFALNQQFDEALAELDRALELAPDDPSAHLLRARVRLAKAKPEEAVEDIDQVFTTRPATADALLLRALAYQQLGKIERALTDIDEALGMQPEFVPALRIRAVLLASNGQVDDALADLEKVRAQQPEDIETLLQLGALYRQKKDASKAIELYDEALKYEPESWFVLHSRGDAYLSISKQAEALADYDAAVKLHQESPNLLNNLAWLLATSPDDKLRDGKRAIELATKAGELTDFKEAYILSTIAASYAEAGDMEKALEWSTKAVDLSPAELKENIKQELASYQQGKPWRELQSDGDTGAGADDASEKSADEK